MNTIDLNRPIKEIVTECPEVIEIMKTLGFTKITNPTMMNTVGRVITINKGARMQGIDLEIIKKTFEQHGFTIIDK